MLHIMEARRLVVTEPRQPTSSRRWIRKLRRLRHTEGLRRDKGAGGDERQARAESTRIDSLVKSIEDEDDSGSEDRLNTIKSTSADSS